MKIPKRTMVAGKIYTLLVKGRYNKFFNLLI